MRDVKTINRRQNAAQVDAAAAALGDLPVQSGWIERFRTALGMSITELADRVGVARPTISKLESREKDGGATLAQLDKVARAMGGRLVYAVVPAEGTIDDLVMNQARTTARRIIRRTRAQMALEAQSDGLQSPDEAVEELARELARDMRRGFWS